MAEQSEYADLFPPEDASRWAWQHRATVPVALRYAFVLALVTVLLQWLLPAQEPASDDALRTAVRIAQTLAPASGLFFLGVVWIRHAGRPGGPSTTGCTPPARTRSRRPRATCTPTSGWTSCSA